jgi:hypothetical protein
MEQTAVEWIEGYLKKFNHIQESLSLRKAIEKAKEIEKEEKHAEYMRGWKDGYSCKSIKNKLK